MKIMYDNKRRACIPRCKTGKGIGKKKLMRGSKAVPSRSPPSSRTDEDSGLGGDSSVDSDPTVESGTISLAAKQRGMAVINISSNTVPTTAVMLPSYGVSPQILSVDANTNSKSKRLRLDMTEEANELPEEKLSTSRYRGVPPIVSFKNVPDFMLPANLVQKSSIPRQSLLSRNPNVEQIKKNKSQFARPHIGVVKVDKPYRKKSKGFLLDGNYSSKSSDGTVELQLLSQPEFQHRARYQTEGSRGAVKDRSGLGHPTVQLVGYKKNAVLQVYVASDGGTISPHVFYQACKVSGKNSTPCKEEKVNGTTVLDIALVPENGMIISCDCVGILKERNVDVEQRMKSVVSRGRKKSTKCRLVFRTSITLASGLKEILQIVSQPISCTQPPGIPEISRKSVSKYCAAGGGEMFIIGKNFLKDSEVLFQELCPQKGQTVWTTKVIPDKDYLQSNHLICEIPPYRNLSIEVEVEVQVIVTSCGKMSDPHTFHYQPALKKKESHQDSVQLHVLPKGVSPSAVKLNQLYAETGSGLFFSKENGAASDTTTMPLKQNGSVNREQAVVNPFHVNPKLVTVNPSVHTTTIVTNSALKNVHANTFTTATVINPKPVPLTRISPRTLSICKPISIPQQTPIELSQLLRKNEMKSVTAISEPESTTGDQGKENILDILLQMLKIIKNLPGNLQTPIVDLVAEEILKQCKRNDGNAIKSKNLAEGTQTQNLDTATLSNVSLPLLTSKPSSLKVEGIKATSCINSYTERKAFQSSNGNNWLTSPMAHVSHTNELSIQTPEVPLFPLTNTQQIPMQTTTTPTSVSNSSATYSTFTLQNAAKNFPEEQKIYISSSHCTDGLSYANGTVEKHNQISHTNPSSEMSMDRLVNQQPLALVPTQSVKMESLESSQFNVASPNLTECNFKIKSDMSSVFASQENSLDISGMRFVDPLFTTTPCSLSVNETPSILFTNTQDLENPSGSMTSQNSNFSQGYHDQNCQQTDKLPSLNEVISTSTSSSLLPQPSPQYFVKNNSTYDTRNNIGKNDHCTLLESSSGLPTSLTEEMTQNQCLDNKCQPSYLTLSENQSLNLSSAMIRSPVECLGSGPIDASLVMHMENCDPLLSQANANPSLHIGPTRNCNNIMQMNNESLLENNQSTHNAINSSEVTTTISQLSDNELMNYINTNCFDNV